MGYLMIETDGIVLSICETVSILQDFRVVRETPQKSRNSPGMRWPGVTP